MRRSRNVGVALVGLLVVAAISVAAGSGRKPVLVNSATSVRMLTEAEVAQVCQQFPKLGSQQEGIARIGSDLLARLFPGSSFYRVYHYDYDPEIPYLVATSGDKLLPMPNGFNRLLHEHGVKVTDKNVMEMAEAFALLVLGNAPKFVGPEPGTPARLDTFPPVTFLEAKRTKLKYGGSTYEAELKMRIGGQDEEWYFEVWRGQFGSVVRRNTKGVTIDFYVPIPVESPPGQGLLDTQSSLVVRTDSGSNAYVQHDDSGDAHYYVTVDSNNIALDNQVVFSLSGFLPDSNVYVLVYDFIRNALIPRYLHKVQMHSGCGRDTWKPGADSTPQTFIYHVSAGYVSDTTHAWDTYTDVTLKSEISPEKVIAGTFPGYDTVSLKIHYCDQFFSSPVNDTHAVTFARYVDSAMMQSWRTQVNTWGLGAPPDSDRKHEVFINDETHWYHSEAVATSYHKQGSNREYGMPSMFKFSQTYPVCGRYSSESILVASSLAHEFYHAVQWVLDPLKGSSAQWKWFKEGQARFMQSAQCPAEEFDTTGGLRMYAGDANDFLVNGLNTSPANLSYPYCLFWRCMYEHFHKDTFPQPKTALQLVSDCYAENVGTSNSIGRGKAAINAAINKYRQGHTVPPAWNNFGRVLDQFAVACYLNDTLFQLWNPNPLGLYSRPYLTTDTAFRLGPNETDQVKVIDSIPHSYGMDFMQVALNGIVDTVRVSLARDANGTLSARMVKVYPTDSMSSMIRDSVVPAIAGSSDSSTSWRQWTLPTAVIPRMCLVITRQDTLGDSLCNYTAEFRVKRAVAVCELLPVTDTVIAGTEFTPKAVVANRGWMKETFPAVFEIGTAYSDTQFRTLAPGDSATIVFKAWTTTKGFRSTCCWVNIASDSTRSDDTLRGSLVALADTWQDRPDVPDSVYIGGALAAVGDTCMYVLRGGRTRDFYRYNVRSRDWDTMAPVPYDISYGAALAWDRGAYVYAVRGCSLWNVLDTTYHHSELLRYNIESDAWDVASTTPQWFFPNSSLVCGGDGRLYALAGGYTPASARHFYQYDAGSKGWSQLLDVPVAPGRGASMCWDQAGHIYALCTNADTFCQYDIGADTWYVKQHYPCPVVACYSALAYDSLGDRIYGLTDLYSGKEAFRYDADNNTWLGFHLIELPDSVGYGCGLARCAGFLYCLRGNTRPDFWRYAPDLSSGKSRLAAAVDEPGGSSGITAYRLVVSPNPVRGAVCVQWQVGEPGPVTLRVFDNAGRVVRTIQNGYQTAGRYSERWDGVCDDGRRAACGIFFYRMDAPGFSKIVKVVAVGM